MSAGDTAKHGYYFVHVPGLHALYERFRSRDFDADVPAAGIFQRRISEEEWSDTFKEPQQRASWFIDQEWTGPYGSDFAEFYQLIEPHWKQFIKDNELETMYDQAGYTFSMGVHRYDPHKEGAGLNAHVDVGLVTFIYSNEPLEGLVDHEWQTIKIPKDHLMVFTGLTTALAVNEPALQHRVPHVTTEKFTIGAFIGASPDAKLVVSPLVHAQADHGNLGTIADLNTAYFSGALKWCPAW